MAVIFAYSVSLYVALSEARRTKLNANKRILKWPQKFTGFFPFIIFLFFVIIIIISFASYFILSITFVLPRTLLPHGLTLYSRRDLLAFFLLLLLLLLLLHLLHILYCQSV